MTSNLEEVLAGQSTPALMGRKFSWGRTALIALALVVLSIIVAAYYKRNYDGLRDRTAIDQAQIARNISSGMGFSTNLIRPFNASLRPDSPTNLPELNTAPIYPYIVSLLFKFREPCDQVVIWASLGFLMLTLGATFLLGRVLFDWKVGLIAAAVVGLSASVLQAGCSGRELTLAAFEFTLLLLALALHHGACSAERRGASVCYTLAAAALTAALYMTNYVYAFALLPLAIYFGITGPFRRLNLAVFLGLAIILMAPCAYRNSVNTGLPVLGVRGWDIMAKNPKFPGDTLWRCTDSANRDPSKPLLFPLEEFGPFAQKLVTTSAALLGTLLPLLGIAALSFAAVSVLYRFKMPAANAVRRVMYGLIPIMVIVFGLYNESANSMIVFVPVVAVFGSAYLMLLVQAKKLHPFFAHVLVGGFLAVTAIQSVAPVIWGIGPDALNPKADAAGTYFGGLGSRGFQATVYTDVPWVAAWRTKGQAVWLPLKDADIYAMESKGFLMRIVILTPESSTYSENETWWLLHEVRLWREYIKDPAKGMKEILSTVTLKAEEIPIATKTMQRLKRNYMVSSTISGFVTKQLDPLGADEIQVLLHPDMAEAQ